VEQNYPSQTKKKLMYQALAQSILLKGAETWALNTQQANKLLATEMDFWRISARKSRKEKVRNVTIREIMEAGKNILEVCEISSSHGGEYDVQSCLLGFTRQYIPEDNCEHAFRSN
jgi:hypothetical protein